MDLFIYTNFEKLLYGQVMLPHQNKSFYDLWLILIIIQD